MSVASAGEEAAMAAQFRLPGLELGLQPLTPFHLVLPSGAAPGRPGHPVS
jgi:hypothetical protein